MIDEFLVWIENKNRINVEVKQMIQVWILNSFD